MTHVLKTWPEYWQAVSDGRKPFEVRYDDREFKVGDTLELHEWNPSTRLHTGRALTAEVTYAAMVPNSHFIAMTLGNVKVKS